MQSNSVPDAVLEDEEEYASDEEDSDLICECGNMKFIVRYQEGNTFALCPECGELIELD